MTADLKDLKELAEAATPGPWCVMEDEYYCGGFGCTPDGCHGHSTGKGTWVDGPHIVELFEGAGIIPGDPDDDATQQRLDKEAYDAACADAAFIAAANPKTVLELIARVEDAEDRSAELTAAYITITLLESGLGDLIKSYRHLSNKYLRHDCDMTSQQANDITEADPSLIAALRALGAGDPNKDCEVTALRAALEQAKAREAELRGVIDAAEMAQTRLNDWADKCHNGTEVDRTPRDWSRKIWGSFSDFRDRLTAIGGDDNG